MSDIPKPPLKDLDQDLWEATYKLCSVVRPIQRRELRQIAREYCPVLRDAARHLGVSYQRAGELIVDTGKRMIRFGEIRQVHPVAYLLGATSEPDFAEYARQAPNPTEAVRGYAEVVDARVGRNTIIRRN